MIEYIYIPMWLLTLIGCMTFSGGLYGIWWISHTLPKPTPKIIVLVCGCVVLVFCGTGILVYIVSTFSVAFPTVVVI